MKNIIIILIVAVVIAAGYFLISKVEIVKDEVPVGMIATGTYNATSTFTGINNGMGACRNDGDVLVFWDSSNPVTLGSVTVASTTPHAMRIKSATSTTANASTTKVWLPANLPQGTYNFDMSMYSAKANTSTVTQYINGMVLDFEQGFCGEYVITWR